VQNKGKVREESEMALGMNAMSFGRGVIWILKPKIIVLGSILSRLKTADSSSAGHRFMQKW